MNACNDWSSDLLWSVQSLGLPLSARVAQVITVDSSANVQTVKQMNEYRMIHGIKDNSGSQPGFRALDARASSAVTQVLQTSLNITVSCLVADPSIQIALRITVVSCSAHPQLFKQQHAGA